MYLKLFNQPYKAFFSLAFCNGALFLLLFTMQHKLKINPLFFHSYSMIFFVFSNFFYGFSLTTFPKFAQTPPINQKSYSYLFFFNLLATILFIIGLFFKEALLIALTLILFSFTLLLKIYLSIYKKAQILKNDLYSIILAFGMGVLSNILFFVSLLPNNKFSDIYLKYAINVGIHLYMLFLAITIAFKMIPFFSNFVYRKSKTFNTALFFLLLFYTISQSYYPKITSFFSLLLALFFVRELIKMHFELNKHDGFLGILHLGLIYLPLSFFLDAIIKITQIFEPSFSLNFFTLHLLMLGFLNTIAIGFIARISLAHANLALKLSKSLLAAFLLTQVVVIFRSFYALWQGEFLFYLAIGAFVLLYFLMLFIILPIYVKK